MEPQSGPLEESEGTGAGQTSVSRRSACKFIAASVMGASFGAGCSQELQQAAAKAVSSDPFELDPELQAHMLDRLYSGGKLEKALRKKLVRRVSGTDAFAPCAIYNSLVVFDKGDLEGGGLTFGQDFTRALLALGRGRCERIFEFCSGPAYIGYSLLAHGFCEKLTLSDINPKAIAAARKTASFNNIDHLVNTYVSDGLKQIPETEKWDLVVSNPPHFMPQTSNRPDLILHDVGWLVHRDFYRAVKKFMKPGGHVVFVENSNGSRPEDFEPMVREGGGTVVSTWPLVLVNGKKSVLYYVASKW